MFSLCANMKWSHLPVAGGLYDQDPDLLDKFAYIFAEIQKEEARKDEERKRKDEADRKKQERNNKSPRRVPRSRRR